MVRRYHPESVIRTARGKEVPVKVHRCLWSGAYPENSLAGIEACYRAAVARAEIDVQMLRDGDFLVMHDPTLERTTTGAGLASDSTREETRALRLRHEGRITAEWPPLLSEVADLVRAVPSPTVMELDLITAELMPWARVEELARLVEPIKERVLLNGHDWNMRRLLEVDTSLAVAFDLFPYFDWVPVGDPEAAELGLPRGAYGYLDAHPLPREATAPVREYLADRLGTLARLVPGAREVHVRLSTFERILDDGFPEVVELFHHHGLLLDVWTLNAGIPRWRERLARALAADVDVVTSDTPRALAAAGAAES